jgi:hypothetical protein
MASSYPGALDTLANPSPTDTMNDGDGHAAQHADANDAIEAIQATLGVDPQGGESTVADRLDAIEGGGGGGGGGLVLVDSAGISSASSGSIDSVFDATFDEYYVQVDDLDVSGTDVALTMRLRASATADTSGNYVCLAYYVGPSNGIKTNTASGTEFTLGGFTNGYRQSVRLRVSNPHLAKQTPVAKDLSINYPGSGPYMNLFGGVFKTTTVFDGVEFGISSGTMSGTIRVFGIPK